MFNFKTATERPKPTTTDDPGDEPPRMDILWQRARTPHDSIRAENRFVRVLMQLAIFESLCNS